MNDNGDQKMNDNSEQMETSDAVDARSLFNYVFGKDSRPSSVLPTGRDDEEYNMNHKSRGKCIIINNKHFDQHVKLSDRRGTEVDADKLYWRFYFLNFTVEKHNDLTVHEMTEVLQTAGKEDHTDNDCFVCCVLSHGDNGVIYGRDGKIPVDSIFSPFRGDACPTLAGKPKLFFIQACQGDQLDQGIKMKTGETETDSGGSLKIPTQADFLMAYSTVPGYYSWRNTANGSWFIQGLCYILEKYGDKMDMLTMMGLVNRFVAYGFESCVPGDLAMHEMKQVPYITFTLTRKLILRPKGISFSA